MVDGSRCSRVAVVRSAGRGPLRLWLDVGTRGRETGERMPCFAMAASRLPCNEGDVLYREAVLEHAGDVLADRDTLIGDRGTETSGQRDGKRGEGSLTKVPLSSV